MKILINGLSAVVGGGVTYLSNVVPALSRALVGSGHRISLLHRPEIEEHIPRCSNISLLPIEGENLYGIRRLLWESRSLEHLASDIEADVIFTPTQTGSHIDGRRNILMLRNMEPFLHSKFEYSAKSKLRNIALSQYTKHALRRADRVIAVSDYTAKFAVESIGVQESKVLRIYHGRDPDYGNKSQAADSNLLNSFGINTPYIFTCGSILPYRKCEFLIDVFNLFRIRSCDESTLVIAGKGTDQKYANMIERAISASPFSSNIRAIGHVDKNVMQVLYRNADVFITASEIEACPNIAIEAMASGCPIIAGETEPMPEIIQSAGLYYVPGDKEGAANRVSQILNNVDLRIKLSKRARIRAKHFNWETTATETLSALTRW